MVPAVSKGARKAVTALTKGCASKRKKNKFEKKAPKVTKLGEKKKPKWKLQAEGGFRPAARYPHVPHQAYS